MTEKNNSLLTSIKDDINTNHTSYSTKRMNNMLEKFLNLYFKIDNSNDESKKRLEKLFSI